MFRVGKSVFGTDDFRGLAFVGRKPYFDAKASCDGLIDALSYTIQYTDNVISFMNRVKIIFEQKNTVLSGINANVKINNKRMVFSSKPKQDSSHDCKV
jgi:hypothetical protein